MSPVEGAAMSELLIAPVVLLLGLLGVAVVSDLRSHRIPNLLVLLGLVLGLVGQTWPQALSGWGIHCWAC